jgi:uncharacterized protein (TIGR02453 family)
VTFSGFPTETITFLAGLKANNERAWFEAHRETYERAYRRPGEAFAETIAAELGTALGQSVAAKVFRIHRDVRFAKDKSPYNPHLHISFAPTVPADGGRAAGGFYFGLEPNRLHLGGGTFDFGGGGVDRYRKAVADDVAGPHLEALIGSLEDEGYRVAPPELKRSPAPYSGDHPRAALLRRKSLGAWRETTDVSVVSSPSVVTETLQAFQRLAPLVAWLNETLAP